MHYGQPPKTTVWVTTADAAKMLYMSTSQVAKLVKDGKLHATKLRGRLLVKKVSILIYQGTAQ